MKNLLTLLCIVCACIGFISCDCDQDISYQVFTRTDPRCSNYQGKYCSHIQDQTIATPTPLEGKLIIMYSVDTDTCGFVTNGIPNHDVNDGSKKFPNTPAPINGLFTITNTPTTDPAGPTALSTDRYTAILLNGAIVDLVSDGCCVEGTDGGTDKQVGCGSSAIWRLNPMNPAAKFTTDTHNAHCQETGLYHYHGSPIGVYEYPSTKVSPVIGFAADGFPIHGPYFEDDKGVIREAISSYKLAGKDRPSSGCPFGELGKYIDDYCYDGHGDLDRCNGMVVKGQYYYFVTNEYPYMIGCFTGKPDPSFDRKGTPTPTPSTRPTPTPRKSYDCTSTQWDRRGKNRM